MSVRVSRSVSLSVYPSICSKFKKSSPLKPLGQMQPKLAWTILRVYTFKIVSVHPASHPTWLLLLWIFFKVEFYANELFNLIGIFFTTFGILTANKAYFNNKILENLCSKNTWPKSLGYVCNDPTKNQLLLWWLEN